MNFVSPVLDLKRKIERSEGSPVTPRVLQV